MVQFDKLRLSGFKSFVDPTELAIESGMTGIVGPNGCGKSNLVEALKWVMGETSAKQMRGSEMEDVIFAGAGTRPARNIAEVMLTLDNKTRTAPAMVNDTDQLDVVRRIERGHGSAYSVNGKEIRARDVQTLFADAATGSRSTALVSQGRVGTLINAKPADRRSIIDEAAGITGLYARRHEAELRLRAAEQNLARVQDVLVALEEQHKGLKRQARQASRYRNLSDHIRRAEATVLALKLAHAEKELAESGERLKEAEAQVADLTRLVGLATTAQAEASTALPPLRNDEAAAAAALQRLRSAHDALTAEAERVAAAQQDAETRLQQTQSDLAREQGRKSDADAAIADLDTQRAALEQARVGEDERAASAQQARDEAQEATVTAEAEHDRLTRQIADDEALRNSVSREIAELQDRLRRLTVRREELANTQRQIESEMASLPALPEVEAALEAARAALEEARRQGEQTIEAAREAERYESDAARQAVAKAEAERIDMERARAAERQAAEASHAAAAETLQKTNAKLTKLRAEEGGVAAALKSAADSLWPPLLDALTVAPGFEKALGAAFGEDLEASSDRGAPSHWLPLGAMAEAPALPEGATPLSMHVQSLPELERRLAFIGIVADDATGAALQPSLKAGQQLVTAEGAVWRWDGYTVRAGAHRVAVPAPHSALGGDQLLAGLEAGLQRRTRCIVGHDADEGQAALELGQALHVHRQRRGAFRQRRRFGHGAERQPMGRRAAVGRGFEVLAESGTQRLLEARRDSQCIEQRRPQRVGGGLQGSGDAAFFGAQLGELGVGLLQGLGRGGVARLGSLAFGGAGALHVDALGLGLGDGLAGGVGLVALGLARGLDRLLALAARFLEGCAGGFEGGLDLRQRRQARHLALDLALRVGQLLATHRQTAQAILQLGDLAAHAVAQRFVVGDLAGQAIVLGLSRDGRFLRFVARLLGRRRALVLADAGLLERSALGVQIGDRCVGVALAALFPGEIGLGLLKARLGILLGGGDPLGFGRQRIVRRAQALQRCSGGSFVVAQRRQRRRGFSLRGGGEAHETRQVGDLRFGFLQALTRLRQFLLGMGELEGQHRGFGAADMVGEVAIAARLARLPLQALVLLLEGYQHVLDARKVLLGRAQAQLGLVTAGIETGDAGRLVDDRAAVGGLGVDQGADAALADQRGRARAGRGVGKQRLHVARADFLAVDRIGRAVAALDAAHDVELVGVVHHRGRRARLVVERQHDFGDIARGPGAGAGEDHVLHLRAAHLLGRGLAHHPLQRLDQVRLAAAVGTDDAGHAGLNGEFRRIDEGLETGEPEFVELHHLPHACLIIYACRLLGQLGEQVIELLEGARAFELLAVDEDRRRRVDAQCLAAAIVVDHAGRHRIVGEASLHFIVTHAGDAQRLRQLRDRVLGHGPVALAAEDHVEHGIILVVARALGELGGLGGDLVEREVAVDQLHLAGRYPLLLDVGQHRGVEVRAVRAGQRGVLDHGDRRVGIAHHMVARLHLEQRLGVGRRSRRHGHGGSPGHGRTRAEIDRSRNRDHRHGAAGDNQDIPHNQLPLHYILGIEPVGSQTSSDPFPLVPNDLPPHLA